MQIQADILRTTSSSETGCLYVWHGDRDGKLFKWQEREIFYCCSRAPSQTVSIMFVLREDYYSCLKGG